jgi:hypothetical protein
MLAINLVIHTLLILVLVVFVPAIVKLYQYSELGLGNNCAQSAKVCGGSANV